MLSTVALAVLALSAVTSTAIPRKGEYLRELAAFLQPAMERETASLLKKRTYGSLSLGGSYGTAKRGDLSLLRLGSGFGRSSRNDDRLNENGEMPHQILNSYSRDKYEVPRVFELSTNEVFPMEKNSRSRSSEEASIKQFSADEFNQDD